MLALINSAFAAAAVALTNAEPPRPAPLPPRLGIPKPIHAPENVKTIPSVPRTTQQ